MTKEVSFLCAECAAEFRTRHPRKLYCSPTCQKARKARNLARGVALPDLLMAYRAGRNRKDPLDREAANDALVQAWRLVAAMIEEDRAAGRADAVKLYRRRMAAGVIN